MRNHIDIAANLDSGFKNKGLGLQGSPDRHMQLSPGIDPALAMTALAEIARYVDPGEWAAIVADHPGLDGVLVPVDSREPE